VADIEFLDDGGIREIVMEGSKDCSDAVVGSVTQCLYSVKRPMDFGLMGQIMRKTGTQKGVDPDADKEQTISNMAKTPDGQEILGTKRGEHIDKVVDIFKKLHNR
jgi:hypothetical protein